MNQTPATIKLNQAAELVPMSGNEPEDERPSIRVADVLVFAYVELDEDCQRRLVVSVDLEDVPDSDEWLDGPVSMRINVQGIEVFSA